MGSKLSGIDGKGYANTTYISEFHPQIQNLYVFFRSCVFCMFGTFHVFWNQNRVSGQLIDQSLTGVGYIDADWKVSTFKMNIILGLCTKSSKSQWKVGLTIKSWISALWVMGFFVKNPFPHIRSREHEDFALRASCVTKHEVRSPSKWYRMACTLRGKRVTTPKNIDNKSSQNWLAWWAKP